MLTTMPTVSVLKRGTIIRVIKTISRLFITRHAVLYTGWRKHGHNFHNTESFKLFNARTRAEIPASCRPLQHEWRIDAAAQQHWPFWESHYTRPITQDPLHKIHYTRPIAQAPLHNTHWTAVKTTDACGFINCLARTRSRITTIMCKDYHSTRVSYIQFVGLQRFVNEVSTNENITASNSPPQ